MSDTNEIKIVRLETQMKNVEQKVDEGFRYNKEEMTKLNKKMDDFIESAEKKYASKWVELIVWAGVSATLLTILGALLALVLK